ncbi:ferredoxin [Streptomyces gardneri]|uniref:ferredoxin n=1 Tax=Nocardia sputi TaxID=2943705 RepID=UPI0018932498|nr:ferredoxin [Nocardia sputi]MBF6165516.1 ferredoxin [Streptomyces gardneri]UAK34574.1 ferredoxin [Nocardia asteroides]
MKINVDRQLCIGAGMCALTAPQVFDQDHNGKSVVLRPEPPRCHHAAVREAEQACPAAAIRIDAE